MHGDFGRTVPNVSKILGAEVDIVGLDVMNVKLEWPPQEFVKIAAEENWIRLPELDDLLDKNLNFRMSEENGGTSHLFGRLSSKEEGF